MLHWKHLPIIQIVVQLMTNEVRFFRNSEKKRILGLKLTSTTPVEEFHPVGLNTFNEVDITPR